MASIFRIALLIAVLAAPLVFADVGPGPASPKITVHLVSNGQPASGINQITYHCMNISEAEPGSVNPYPVDFPCTNGTCTNSGDWYYKFNPCFNFPVGYFTYQYGGKEVRTEPVGSNESFENHDLTIDASTGQVSGNVNTSCSMPGFILIAVLFGAAAIGASRRK